MSVKGPLPERLKPLYPFEGRCFETTWGPMHYLDEGEGTPVVMLHGNPTWSFYYRNLVLSLRDRYRCLVPDLPGCGFSTTNDQFPATLDHHIELVAKWIDFLGLKKFHLIVHDWGGAIGAGVVSGRQEQVMGRVVFNTAAFPAPELPWRIAACRIPGLGTLMVRGGNVFVRAALSMTTTRPLSDAVKEAYLLPHSDWASRRSVDAFVRDIPMYSRHRSWPTLVQIEESLSGWREAPVLIIWGMKDWCFTPQFLAGWRERIPEAEVVKLADAGHWLLEDEPEMIAEKTGTFLDALKTEDE